jgi:hypothetical protein
MTGASGSTPPEGVLHIDCEGCQVRPAACGDCVVTVLLGAAPSGVELDPVEAGALRALADGGLVPPLRHQAHPLRPAL